MTNDNSLVWKTGKGKYLGKSVRLNAEWPVTGKILTPSFTDTA